METETGTASLVGAVGGAGATRLTVEIGATLARAGREVAVLDAAYATQGLSRYVPGRIDVDVTAVTADDAEFDDALADVALDAPGRLAVCPARAPFERLARAKTAGAAEAFASLVDAAGRRFDHALVDVPPVATNQAVAAVTATDRVALVAPASQRGADAVQRTRERLADVGAAADVVLANRTADDHPVESAAVAVPEGPEDAPACATAPDDAFAPAVAAAAEAVVDDSLDLAFPESGLLDSVPVGSSE